MKLLETLSTKGMIESLYASCKLAELKHNNNILQSYVNQIAVAMYRVCTGIMSQMVLWVHPIITGYQKTSVFQRKGVNQAYVVLRVVMVR